MTKWGILAITFTTGIISGAVGLICYDLTKLILDQLNDRID